jgi:uracil-DNA glycosylase
MTLDELLADVRACRRCEAHLEPRPVLRVAPDSRILLIGQAPGARVHASGVPWKDASGDHLRAWLGVDRETFYEPANFGILPIGLCYPGTGAHGDLPPPPICAPTWHAAVRAHMAPPALTLLVGVYAHRHYLGVPKAQTVTATVAGWARDLPAIIPLPHPSWRNRAWMSKNPWFAEELLPVLRARVNDVLRRGGTD